MVTGALDYYGIAEPKAMESQWKSQQSETGSMPCCSPPEDEFQKKIHRFLPKTMAIFWHLGLEEKGRGSTLPLPLFTHCSTRPHPAQLPTPLRRAGLGYVNPPRMAPVHDAGFF